ncbi:DUF4139 domain-containing protein [Flavobacterium sp. '19STA2R22 D10 B1']|uniref:DUF4139 domain-containing protein n=1 Tax=Flavobacterium aerium TaxID=3037261 RepID=UPI00278BFC0F|nr:DUF4139 domain-containing protein [Flavobacterium sp. '19STA2R22 D10 B1']
MKKIFLFSMLFVSALFYAQKPIFTTAKVKAATVYFNSAELTQTTNVNIPAGTHEIVIKNIANYLNENSIQISAPASLTVLSVQFTDDYLSEYEMDENSPTIKKVKDSITLVRNEMAKLLNIKNSEIKTIELLDKNQQVSGANSGLNVAELMKMVEYYKSKRTEVSNSINVITEKEFKLNKTLQRLNTKLDVNTSKEDKESEGKLILQVMNTNPGNVALEISYLTPDASWAPFYDLKIDNVTDPIAMVYKAQVIQKTGIDWKKVKLTLSSGRPNQNNQIPTLSPWNLYYQEIYVYDESVSNQGSAVGVHAKKSKNYATPQPISEMKETQSLQEVVVTSISNYTTINENQLNISFDIDIPYDILSNGKKHGVSLKDVKLPAKYKFFAAPKMEKEAFLVAEVLDYSKYNLLRGEANIIFEGKYIGKTVVDPGQTNDTLRLSMGRDKKVNITREKIVDKSGTKFLSSKKEQTFTYDITVRNNKKEAIVMTLEDQYPISMDKEVEVELKQKDGAKVNSESGKLIWDLNLKPNETKKIRLSYTVKYPKDRVIENL